VKYLDPDSLIQVFGDVSDTVSAAVRDYVTVTQAPTLPRTDNDNWRACEKIVEGFKPQLSLPGVYEDCVMVDLSSAYWEIIRRVGYTVRYNPGRGLGVQAPITDFPYKGNKLARAMLLVSAMESGLWWWDGCSRTYFEKTFNPCYQPMLVALVYDVLHGVASDMKDMLLYYNVDGGIIRRAHLPIWEEVAASWGLPWKVKGGGYAMVKSVGNYWIGNMRTRSRGKTNVFHDNLKPRNPWLRERFLAFSELSDPT
jgi:hypothetical protein